ncbi:MAG TPA: plastocyanin/azurin family copper-binding protein [Solirubrobacteraceae bacterium]|nr:plastocyanin/azurin family copper-binding protein [Solirubrobacteraceae bacterium]
MSSEDALQGPRRRPARAMSASRLGAGGALLLALGALVATGCGEVKGADNANLIAGKKAFVAKCGSCHTLAHAETKGVVGPNLDEAFRASIEEGLQRSTIRGVVEEQIKIPNPEGAMPKNLVSGSTARDIAAYVEKVAAAPGKDSGLLATAVAPAGSGKPAEEKNGKLTIPASPTGQLAYATDKATATAGSVTIEMPNMSGVTHNLAVEAGSHESSGPGPVIGHTEIISKGSSSVTVKLKPGTYTFFCQVPGHRAAGMFGHITVK